MESANKNKLMQELALLLICLSSWKDKNVAGEIMHRSWKGYDFDILDQLQKQELIDFSYRAKSVCISEEGMRKAAGILEVLEKRM